MILYNLIIPLIIAGIIIFISKNEAMKRMFTISGILITLLFLISYIFSTDNTSTIYSLIHFNSVKDVMVLSFSLAFILGLAFITVPKHINYDEVSLIFVYFACAIGILNASDLLSLFIFWEVIALTGGMIVAMGSGVNARKAAFKYLIIHIIGGVFFLIGIISYMMNYESLDIVNYRPTLDDPFNYFILIGILINLGLPPFTGWIIDGYSRCSLASVIFLSVFTTKSALFVLFNLFYGTEVLIIFGIIIVTYSIFLSIIETNIRRLVAISIVQQLGIITVIIAVSNYALTPFVSSYIVVNMFYKMLLLMILMILFTNIKRPNSDIYKYANSINVKSVLGIVLIIVALQSLGAPFTGGFIAKAYVSNDISPMLSNIVSYFVVFASASVALNVGIRIPYNLINFKNTAKRLTFNKMKLIPIFIIILCLETIFVTNYHLLTFDAVLHFLWVIILGIILFILHTKLFKKKENKINNRIMYVRNNLVSTINKTCNNTFNIDIIGKIVTIAKHSYNLVSKRFIISNPYTTSTIAFIVVLVFVTVYLISRTSI